MEKINLVAQIRAECGKNKVNTLRRDGFIPAVIYGKGMQSLNIKISRSEFLRFIHEHRIETTVFNLVIKDSDKKTKEYTCMIKEIQYHPLTSEVIHIDFNHISLTKLIKVKVPIVAKGEPVGVKQEGGILERLLWEIEVECLPTDIPSQIEVDVSNLKINDSILVKDIGSLGKEIRILADPEIPVFTVTAAVKEEVAVETAGEEKLEPEVIKEKKETAEEKVEGKESKE
jgi:large subunit ribosomal protein L25